ncbi:MAG: LCP family protein [Clostridiales bacterium]|nr:LCP family protein [Clostridiales bacterium]
MHTDDDIFESLSIDEGLTDNNNTDDIFEDLDMEDRIFETALIGDRKSEGTVNAAGTVNGGFRQEHARTDSGAGNDRVQGGSSGTGFESSADAGSEKGQSRETAAGQDRETIAGRSLEDRTSERRKSSPRVLNTIDSSVDRRKLKTEKEKKKKSKIRRIIICTVVELVTLAFIFAYGYFLRSWNLISRPDIRQEAIENNNISLEKKKEMEGYWNIAVFGVDSRSSNVVERGLNSDVIMIASINKDTGDIKLVSVFRDTYLNISEKNSYNKINQAYAIGGPEQAIAALNKNLDLNIQHYVAFNWKAVADGINILGGVDDIPISKAELYYINAYITETVKATKIGSYQLTSTGSQHLDGVQAVAYGRLRYMDNDFARTERQRNIIKACFKKAKTAGFSVLNNIMVVCFPQVATNIEFNDVIELAQNIAQYNIADTGGFPWSRGDANIGKKGDCVIPTTLESNVIKLHEFLFGDANYQPSDAVISISEKIKSDSNLYKEGRIIESVATDGGVIQRPKETAVITDSPEGEDSGDDIETTLGVDEDGNYIYPTDEDGNYIIPTDENGDVIYPTDADGNIIRESVRPTELSEEGGIPGEPSSLDHLRESEGDEEEENTDGPGGTGASTGTKPARPSSNQNTGLNKPYAPGETGSQTSGGSNSQTAGPSGAIDGPVISEDGPTSLGNVNNSAGPSGASGSSGISTTPGGTVSGSSSSGMTAVSPGTASGSSTSSGTAVSPGSPASGTLQNSPGTASDTPGSSFSTAGGTVIQDGPG